MPQLVRRSQHPQGRREPPSRTGRPPHEPPPLPVLQLDRLSPRRRPDPRPLPVKLRPVLDQCPDPQERLRRRLELVRAVQNQPHIREQEQRCQLQRLQDRPLPVLPRHAQAHPEPPPPPTCPPPPPPTPPPPPPP